MGFQYYKLSKEPFPQAKTSILFYEWCSIHLKQTKSDEFFLQINARFEATNLRFEDTKRYMYIVQRSIHRLEFYEAF